MFVEAIAKQQAAAGPSTRPGNASIIAPAPLPAPAPIPAAPIPTAVVPAPVAAQDAEMDIAHIVKSAVTGALTAYKRQANPGSLEDLAAGRGQKFGGGGRGTGRGGNYPAYTGRTNSGGKPPAGGLTCQLCGGFGHGAKDCANNAHR